MSSRIISRGGFEADNRRVAVESIKGQTIYQNDLRLAEVRPGATEESRSGGGMRLRIILRGGGFLGG